MQLQKFQSRTFTSDKLLDVVALARYIKGHGMALQLL